MAKHEWELSPKARRLQTGIAVAAFVAGSLLLLLPMRTVAGTGNGLSTHYNDRTFSSRLIPNDPNEPWYDEVFGDRSLAVQRERRREGAAGLFAIAVLGAVTVARH